MKKINETFECVHCKKIVPIAKRTCRNHCPFCLVSLHVDGNIPGDRASDCHGKMFPTCYEIRHGNMSILYKCEKCEKEHWNKRAEDDDVDGLISGKCIRSD